MSKTKRKAKEGDQVSVHYTGSFPEGDIFDSSIEREPLSFVIGSGQMIPGFDAAVRGMAAGEKKSVTLEPEEAYGPYNPDLVAVYKKDIFPDDIEIKVGMDFDARMEDDSVIRFSVTAVEGEDITLDANFHMAGKTLVFDIELLSIS